MLIDRVRMFLLSLALGLLAACGGGGGSPGGSMPVPATGSLAVTISNLPAGVKALVKVSGPANFMQDLTQTQTLANLAAGTYTISASTVVSGSATYAPSAASQSATVTAGGSASVNIAYGPVPLSIGVREIASGLAEPVFLAAPAGDGRLFIAERAGRIRIMQNDALLSQPFLDISARVSTAGEGGMLSFAFDPQFASNGRLFVYYIDTGHNIVIERFSLSPNPNLADPTSGLPIIRIAHPVNVNHYGGLASFGPDGYLYLGTGDGGGEGDPPRNAQNLNTVLGKLLRLDVSTASVAQPYAIPPTNPFAGQAGRRGEIWAYGLRNPWRYAFDSGQVYIADVGQDLREEVDIAGAGQAGLNYGWNIMEGTLCYNASACDKTGLALPVFEYSHSGGSCSITGGYVYRGKALPELAARYFYSDYCAGYLKSFLATGAGVVEQTDWAIPNVGRIVSFGRDADGELYLMADTGKLYKVVRAAAR